MTAYLWLLYYDCTALDLDQQHCNLLYLLSALVHTCIFSCAYHHAVHVALCDNICSQRGNAREILVSEPSVYSKRIQCTPEGDCWHFPLENSDQWLCISQTAATAVSVATAAAAAAAAAADATCAKHDTAANNGTSSIAAAVEACGSASAPHAAAIT
jgi:hypothetical protein